MERQTKLLIAIATLLASTLLVTNHIIAASPFEEWWVAGLLFLISVGFWAWMWVEDNAEVEETGLSLSTSTPAPPAPREWVIEPQTPQTQLPNKTDEVPDETPAEKGMKMATAQAEMQEIIDEKPEGVDIVTGSGAKAIEEETTSTPPPGGAMEVEPGRGESVVPDADAVSAIKDKSEAEAARGEEVELPEGETEDLAEVVEEAVEKAEESERIVEAQNGESPAEEAVAEAMAAPPQGRNAEADAQAADEAIEDAGMADDLTRIEGIGPKYSETLIAAGVNTFQEIVNLDIAGLEKVLDDAGMRRPASLDSWVPQAAFAVRDDWDGLAAFQETLNAGRLPDDDES